ncbi:hypothetical protein BpHYR1_045909 [Brachionus plicatilis]|uniref:Uncharacterized protein n=1 Tax=Brachionus plicatilis TaxID=10195 RepID=A0A3M7S740_BRAPC|nr:hypothetical protein BpHYR1_045909 [Brachionus plicatilis]
MKQRKISKLSRPPNLNFLDQSHVLFVNEKKYCNIIHKKYCNITKKESIRVQLSLLHSVEDFVQFDLKFTTP